VPEIVSANDKIIPRIKGIEKLFAWRNTQTLPKLVGNDQRWETQAQ